MQFSDDSRNPSPLVGAQKSQAGSEEADSTRQIHLHSDVDLSPEAQHHTLGKGPTQAALGSHLHEGVYALFSHAHTSDDLPEVTLSDEVIVSDEAPLTDELDVGTVWIDSSIGDAAVEVVYGQYESDVATVSSTIFSHPANWATMVYVPPADGVIDVNASANIDSDTLLNSRRAKFQIHILDEDETIITQHQVTSDYVGDYEITNYCLAPVQEGLLYKIALVFALGNADGGSFDVSSAEIFLKYFPGGQYTYLTLLTDP